MRKTRKYRDNDEPTNQGFIGKLFSATADRLPAHVTEEQDWYMDTPDVRLARVFTIVLILHVVAVGGILAFKMIDKASAPGIAVEIAGEDLGSGSVVSEADARADGQAPVVPAAPDPLIMQDPTRSGLQQYLVSNGETMQSIANDLGLDVKELQRLNSIHVGDKLYSGQWIAIPKNEAHAPRVSPTPTSTPMPTPTAAPVAVAYTAPSPGTVAAVERPAGNAETYVVQPGDTAYGIARRFGMSSDSLMSANGIARAESLQVGVKLRIPSR